MRDVERARPEHDAHGAGVAVMHEVAAAGQPAGLRERHAMPAGYGDGFAHQRMIDGGLRRSRPPSVSTRFPHRRRDRAWRASAWRAVRRARRRASRRAAGGGRASSRRLPASTLSATPPAMRVTERLAWPTSGCVSARNSRVARVEDRHQPPGGDDRVHAEFRAAGMRGFAFGADHRPQAAFVGGEHRIVGRFADDDEIGRSAPA